MLRPTYARVPHRALLSVTGAHSTQYLHGLISLGPPIPPRGAFYTAFLHAQGRVLYDVFVYYDPNTVDAQDGFLIEYDSRPSAAPPLLSLLKRYILRSKVKVKDVSNQWDVWASWGTNTNIDRKWRWAQSGAVEPVRNAYDWPWGGVHDPLVLHDRRAYNMGVRRLTRKGDLPLESSDHEPAPSEAYTSHRILHGVPEGIDDIQPLQAFPIESNLDIMGALDFRKGCYVGQELTVRTYHTGVIRKRIFPVEIKPMKGTTLQPLLPGQDIRAIPLVNTVGKSTRTRGTGKLLSSVGNLGLALLRLEHVVAVSSGNVIFELETDEEEGQGRAKMQVTQFYPVGWPSRGVNEIE